MSKLKTPQIKPGDKFGGLIAVDSPARTFSGEDKQKRWRVTVRCACGKQYSIACDNLLGKCVTSCGCLVVPKRKYGEYNQRIYEIWRGMIRRCETPNSLDFSRYGGRGIIVAPIWRESFLTFHQWAIESGYSESLQIDRINNDGNYEPSNCRWVTRCRNMRNTGRSRMLTAFGESKNIMDWLEDARCAVSLRTLWARLNYGWRDEDAITRPLQSSGNRRPRRLPVNS